MAQPITDFLVHNRHKLKVYDVEAPLDVLTFTGEEHLSEPFKYTIEFTCVEQDLVPALILGRKASFSLYGPPPKFPQMSPDWLTVIPESPLRTVYGVVTAFKRLSDSQDEARYEVILQPRLALLDKGKQYRIYQQQSVPEIVKSILLSRHGFEAYDLHLRLMREYPRREQVMQYGESDLAFISRLLAEVGIWYRFEHHKEWLFEVAEFCDHPCFYQFDIELPHRSPSGFNSDDQDAVWQLQTEHQVVEKNITFRAYNPREAYAWLNGEVDHTGGDNTTYGEAYHYAEPYTELGNALLKDERLETESGHFYARLRHEQYLNSQTRLSGVSDSATLAPGQVLTITGDAPLAFKPRAALTGVKMTAARGSSLQVSFEAIPFSDTVCFRPKVPAKPQIAGTIPARVTSPVKNAAYAEIDKEGRYKVNFLFDRDEWKPGEESLWLRLARPYAGDTHGLHLPLIPGTEVAIAFEHGDPDRPYIAHALHDDRHPDHITDRKLNHTRNVLRTSANNKLRMEDLRGSEHIKLSTEHSGKSQLNLGHLVDAQKQKRGEGFELRTDGWGAIRGGKGLFISADKQPLAQGQSLDMNAALAQLNEALELVHSLAESALQSGALAADIPSQQGLQSALSNLKEAGLLASAPAGIALSTPKNVHLSAGQNITGAAGDSADFSVFKRFSVAAGDAISLFASRMGFKAIAAGGPVVIQAQRDAMTLAADKALTLNSVNGEITLNAAEGITLVSRGAYIKLKDGSIEIGAPGEVRIKNDNIAWGGAASLDKALTPMVLQDPVYKYPRSANYQVNDLDHKVPRAHRPYRIETSDGRVLRGVTDENGDTQVHHGLDTQTSHLFFE